MKYICEQQLRYFDFWSGAKQTALLFTMEQLDAIEDALEDEFEDTPTDTQINDLFWFEPDYVASLIGMKITDDFTLVPEDEYEED